jgi:RNA polymerase sigma factor (sigma-70 family)
MLPPHTPGRINEISAQRTALRNTVTRRGHGMKPPEEANGTQPNAAREKSRSARTDAKDQQLVTRFREGDDAAAAELYKRHHAMAVRLARHTSPVPDAEEIAHEAFTKVLEAIRRGAGPTDSFSLYLRTAVRTTSAQHFRDQSKYRTTDDIERVITEHVPDHAETIEHFNEDVAEAFAALPTRWQEVLHLRIVEGRSNRESAKTLGIKATSEAMLYSRARRGLRKSLAHVRTMHAATERVGRKRVATRVAAGSIASLAIFAIVSLGWLEHTEPTVHTVASLATKHGACAVTVHLPDIFDHDTTFAERSDSGDPCKATYQLPGHRTIQLTQQQSEPVKPGHYSISLTTANGSANATYTVK